MLVTIAVILIILVLALYAINILPEPIANGRPFPLRILLSILVIILAIVYLLRYVR